MSRLSLSAKITLLVAGLLTGLGLVMLATFGVLSARQIDRTIEVDARNTTKQLSLYLAGRSADLTRQAHFAANGVPRLRTLFFLGDAATVREEIPWLTKQFSVDAFQLLDADGRVLGQSERLAGLSTDSKRVIDSVLKTHLERTMVVHSGDQIYVVSCAPVFSGSYPKGAVVLFGRLGQEEVAALSRQAGDTVGFTIDSKLVTGSVLGAFDPPALGDGPKQIDLDGRQFVVVSQRLPNADPAQHLGFVILRSIQEITAPYQEARSAFVAILLVSLVLSLGAGVAFGRGLVRPMGLLADAAQVIQRGDWPEVPKATRQDELGSLQSSFHDMVVAARGAQERLLAMIDLDPLTELSNHRRFRERLSEEVHRCEAAGHGMALALLDLDDFEAFNERQGHAAGDLALRQIAEAMRESLPGFAVSARYGGDRFAALIPNFSTDEVSEVLEDLSRKLGALGCGVTVSGGCSEYPKSSLKEDGLLLAAELALARAKQLGKGQICSFEAVQGADRSADPFVLYQSIEDGSLATIQALAAAVDAKDPYTNGHSERVAEYGSMLSAAVGDTAEMVDRVFRCGTLHDVGKIGVPDAILKKPGRLEPDEQRIMETHAALGELIAGKVPQLADLLPGVRHHHERWDGKGYPDQIAGESIPYIARLLAVADTYDAMTSDRPYRKGMGQEIALGEIQKMAGSQFDPRLAHAFVVMMSQQLRKAA